MIFFVANNLNCIQVIKIFRVIVCSFVFLSLQLIFAQEAPTPVSVTKSLKLQGEFSPPSSFRLTAWQDKSTKDSPHIEDSRVSQLKDLTIRLTHKQKMRIVARDNKESEVYKLPSGEYSYWVFQIPEFEIDFGPNGEQKVQRGVVLELNFQHENKAHKVLIKSEDIPVFKSPYEEGEGAAG